MKIRIISYNIHKCIGGVDRRYAPERVAEVIAHYGADLALLQEVTNRSPRSGGDRQVDLLGTMLDFRYRAWFPNVRLRGGGEYGNAVIAGDLNDIWGMLGRRILHPAGFRGSQGTIRTFPAYAPVRPLDGLYIKGDLELVNLMSSRLKLARQASDHLPLVADLQLR